MFRGCSLTMNSDALVCVAGWEERFAAGLKLDVDRFHPTEIVMIVFQEYKEETQASRSAVVSYAAENQIVCRELSVHREPREVWDTLRSDFTAQLGHRSEWCWILQRCQRGDLVVSVLPDGSGVRVTLRLS